MKAKNIKVGLAVIATTVATGFSLVGSGCSQYHLGTTKKIDDVKVLYNKVGPELISVDVIIKNRHVIEPYLISDEQGTYYCVPMGYAIETDKYGNNYGVKTDYQIKTLYKKY